MSAGEYVLSTNDYCDTSTDDLEKTLVLAAAESDARTAEAQHQTNTSKKHERTAEAQHETNTAKKHKRTAEAQHQTNTTKKHERTCVINSSDDEVQPESRNLKRKLDDDEAPPSKVIHRNKDKSFPESAEGYAKVVATHYNKLEEKGLDERSKSRIFYMRNFHNWIKSMLINEYLTKIKQNKKHNAPIRVHDMCCGKGGDLLKWKKGSITHLICSDIATVSLEQCKQRYTEMRNRNQRDRNPSVIYSVEYIPADCTRTRLREKYKDASVKLDLVSCQFAFHYSFESLPQAECMIKNAAECLEPGGYFIGTMPDANELISRARKSGSNTFGNDLFQVTLDFDVNKPPPLLGGKYNFHLDGVVDCPEFLVYFPVLVKLAKQYGLKLVVKEKFHDFYERMKIEGRNLLSNMKSLETYPPYDGTVLVGNEADDYVHAEEFLKAEGNVRNVRLGTLSKSEWEASSLYMIFVFEKVRNTWNADGDPVFDI